ncbi:hypothetical protein NADFUDRAFT_53676 [Nadsonia fulvescens var. elongata DSM 6958]|uniref:Uncharacterized protein n=1 Tax=Nadsonia fulvescens var. elongata DSM 6958 TaxID=857566 RepID=A0A1E3PDF8_9ASCO|nr:hypothetical protein NADFUDRAFT_53676 [Nadsonia fulvescens var. elongata DSM 6958]
MPLSDNIGYPTIGLEWTDREAETLPGDTSHDHDLALMLPEPCMVWRPSGSRASWTPNPVCDSGPNRGNRPKCKTNNEGVLIALFGPVFTSSNSHHAQAIIAYLGT